MNQYRQHADMRDYPRFPRLRAVAGWVLLLSVMAGIGVMLAWRG